MQTYIGFPAGEPNYSVVSVISQRLSVSNLSKVVVISLVRVCSACRSHLPGFPLCQNASWTQAFKPLQNLIVTQRCVDVLLFGFFLHFITGPQIVGFLKPTVIIPGQRFHFCAFPESLCFPVGEVDLTTRPQSAGLL